METVKGFKDFTGEEAIKREEIRKILVSAFESYGFEPAETPIIEQREFVRGENMHDDAVSDIFKLEDRGKRELALRYEFTFQLKRIMQGRKMPYKRYSIGPVFRDEPVKGNRLRQFIQCDVDIVGSNLRSEAEILSLTKEVLSKLGINVEIYVNNRKLLNEILLKENIDENNFSDVIREIDKLDKLERSEIEKNLKEFGAEKILDIFDKPSSFFTKYENYKEINELVKYCDMYGVKIKFLPSLARGLSYYNGNVFEVKSKEMKETITAGGSYMFNNVQCSGISFGLDRLSLISKIEIENKKVMVISIGEDEKSIEIANELRKNGYSAIIFFEKISKALDYANAKDIGKVVFVGSDEVKKKKVKVRDMHSGKEKLVNIDKISTLIN